MNETIQLLDEVIALLESSSAKQRAMQRQLAKTLRRQQKIAERRFKGELAASFDELGKRAEEAFLESDYKPDEVVQEAAEDSQIIASIMAKLKVSEFVAKELLPKYQAEYLAILKGTYHDVATTLNIGLNLPDPVMRNILAEGGKRVGLLDLEEGTREKLFEILEEGRSQGLGSDALARLIRDEIPAGPWSSSQIRAEVIARTETKYAQNMSAMESYKSSPAVTGVDLINAGQNPCPICQDIANNGPYPVDEAEGIELHPNCLLPDNKVLPLGLEAINRAFYRGQAIELTTEDGNSITITPNHMILTDSGFMKAKFLTEGSYIITSTDSKRIVFGVNPNNNEIPTAIEDIWRSLRMKQGMVISTMPVSPIDFYGDAAGFDGYVDIISPNSFLLNNSLKSTFGKHINEHSFDRGNTQSLSLPSDCPFRSLGNRAMSATSSGMSGGGNQLAILDRHFTCADDLCLAHTPRSNTSIQEALADNIPTYLELSCKFQLRFASLITGKQITKIRKFNYVGHVYDLQSSQSLYIANSIVVKNCLCVWSPHLGEF